MPASAAARPRVTELPVPPSAVGRDMLRFRAVLAIIRAPHGRKVEVARACATELEALGVRGALRTLYRLRREFLLFGVSGLGRRRRSDWGRPRALSTSAMDAITEAASRVRRLGDIRREYGRLRPPISYERFRFWLRAFQKGSGISDYRGMK